MDAQSAAGTGPLAQNFNQIHGRLLMVVLMVVLVVDLIVLGRSRCKSCTAVDAKTGLPHPRPAAALAFYDLVALLQKALALAILALLLFLDVGAFFIGHAILQAMIWRVAER
jgi:hypothetical protein